MDPTPLKDLPTKIRELLDNLRPSAEASNTWDWGVADATNAIQPFVERMEELERDRVELTQTIYGKCDEIRSNQSELASLRQQLAQVQQDNNTLLGLLGNSALPCTYCGLPAADQAKCERGFPGCARADDQMLSEHFAAGWEAEQLRQQLAQAEALLAAEKQSNDIREASLQAIDRAYGDENCTVQQICDRLRDWSVVKAERDAMEALYRAERSKAWANVSPPRVDRVSGESHADFERRLESGVKYQREQYDACTASAIAAAKAKAREVKHGE